MESTHSLASQELLGVVRGVRTRYRAKILLRGAAIAVAGTWVTLALATYGANTFKYSDNAVLGARILTALVTLGLIGWFVVRPLLPKLGDDKVALYLEEHERSLKASLITAVEVNAGRAWTNVPRSPALTDRLTSSALKRAHAANDGRAIDAGELRTNGGILAAVMVGAFLLTMFGPQVLRDGLRLIAAPWGSPVAAGGHVRDSGFPGQRDHRKGRRRVDRGEPARLSVRARRAAHARSRFHELDASHDAARQLGQVCASVCSTSATRRSTRSRPTASARRPTRSMSRIFHM